MTTRTKILGLPLLSALLFVSGGIAGQAASKTYDAAAFFETTDFSLAGAAYAFNASGDKLLITSNETGVFNAYELTLKTGARAALTNSDANATFAVSYFPGDGRFLYTSDGGGDELNHLYVDGPDIEPTDLTPGENLKAGFVDWIEGGAAFIVQSNERDPKFFDLYRYDASTLERRLVFENKLGLGDLAVSRDGRFAAGAKTRSSADNNLYLVDLTEASAEARLISEHEGDISHGVFSFTPENDKLVYATDEHGEFTQAWSYDIASGDNAAMIAADWDVVFVGYSPSGRFRVHGVNADASTELTIYDQEKKRAVKLPKGLPKGSLSGVHFSRDEGVVGFLINADVSPSNVFTVDLKRATFAQHTEALGAKINPNDLVASEVVRYDTYDDQKIPSILYKPKGASASNPAPGLVWVHGGPGGQSRTGYSAVIQHLVNHGFAVLAANNRGSSGYGKTFFHLDDKRHGEDDLQDIVHGRRYLESLDWIDKENIAIIGGSYGGYMVMAALAFEPEVFDAGVNIFGVTNWVRTLSSIPPWWEAEKQYFYTELGDPAVEGERLRRISPLFHAKNVTKPLLVVQGANDPRVLQIESDEIVAAVRANGVPVEYHLFPGEGHGFQKRENRITASEAYVKFLSKYLGSASADSGE